MFKNLLENFLNEMAKKTLPDGRIFNSSELAVIELTRENIPLQEIARLLNTSVESVQSIISVAKRKGTWPQDLNKEVYRTDDGSQSFSTKSSAIVALVEQGLTLDEIAEALNTTKASVSSIISVLRRAGQWPTELNVTRKIKVASKAQVAQNLDAIEEIPAAPEQNTEVEPETPAEAPVVEPAAKTTPAVNVQPAEPEEPEEDMLDDNEEMHEFLKNNPKYIQTHRRAKDIALEDLWLYYAEGFSYHNGVDEQEFYFAEDDGYDYENGTSLYNACYTESEDLMRGVSLDTAINAIRAEIRRRGGTIVPEPYGLVRRKIGY